MSGASDAASPLKRRPRSDAGAAAAGAHDPLLELMLTRMKERQLAAGDVPYEQHSIALPVSGAAAAPPGAPPIARRRCCCGAWQRPWCRALLVLLALAAVALAAGLGGALGARRRAARTPSPPQQPLGPRLDTADRPLLWADDFTGPLDERSWTMEQGDGSEFGLVGWGNAELQCYVASSVAVVPHPDRPDEDGVLRLSAVLSPEPQTCVNGGDAPPSQRSWTSGKVHTKNKVAFGWQPGQQVVRGAASSGGGGVRRRRRRALAAVDAAATDAACGGVVIEARLRVPLSAGRWSAFWLLPRPVPCATPSAVGECGAFGPWPRSGEVDVAEAVNADARVLSTVHASRWGAHAQAGGQLDLPPEPPEGATLGWTIHQLAWNCSTLAFFADGRQVAAVTRGALGADVWPFDQPFYLLLNLAIGGGLTRGVQPDAAGAPLLVDYVRVYGAPQGR